MTQLRRLLREPLIQFCGIGAAFFVAHALVNRNAVSEDTVVVERNQVEYLVAGFARTWHRPPTQAELDGLIRDHIREEIYYREARALALDENDVVIRRRLRQKLEFLSDTGAPAAATEAELSAFLAAHADTFRLEPAASFVQVFFSTSRRSGNAEADARHALDALSRGQRGVDPGAIGDPFLLDATFEAVPAGEIGRLFGNAFALAVMAQEPGRWHGPIASAYGYHLVRVTARTAGAVPALDTIRANVEQEWASEQRRKADEQFYQSLLKRYRIVVEAIPAAPDVPPAPEFRQ